MYCDFIVWLKEDIHIERICPNDDFMADCIGKAKNFFQTSILPELIGKFFSRPAIADSNVPTDESASSQSSTELVDDASSQDDQVYCYCKGPESGTMIGCDNPVCPYQWFHLECLRLSAPPKKKTWYCPDCRKLQKRK